MAARVKFRAKTQKLRGFFQSPKSGRQQHSSRPRHCYCSCACDDGSCLLLPLPGRCSFIPIVARSHRLLYFTCVPNHIYLKHIVLVLYPAHAIVDSRSPGSAQSRAPTVHAKREACRTAHAPARVRVRSCGGTEKRIVAVAVAGRPVWLWLCLCVVRTIDWLPPNSGHWMHGEAWSDTAAVGRSPPAGWAPGRLLSLPNASPFSFLPDATRI